MSDNSLAALWSRCSETVPPNPSAQAQPARFLAVVLLALAATLCPKAAMASKSSRTVSQSTTSINFGTIQVGGNATQQVTVTNSGSASVKITQLTLTGVGFTMSGPALPYTLSGGQTLSLSVTYTPTGSSTTTGSLSVSSNASNSPVSFSLSGTGSTVAQLGASPASLSFGNVTVGSESTLAVVLTNTGSANVTVSQVNMTGTGFSYGGLTLPTTLVPNQNATVDVTFAPTSAGSATGSASVASNAQNSPAVASLSGTGANQHSVSLTWSGSSSTGVSGYNVYRGVVSGGPYTEINTSAVSTLAYTDTTVQAGGTYYYVTTAVDSQGNQSAYSNQTQAVVPSP